jgi:hypothetical protein
MAIRHTSLHRQKEMNTDQQPPGCLLAILKLFGFAPRKPIPIGPLPYKRKDFLLSKAERSFFGVLQLAVNGRYIIFTKVRLADLLDIPRGTEKRQSYFNRIQAKHIDFVICDKNLLRPLLAIELDDSSHNRADRKTRDNFVDAALAAAGLPILHVRASSGYNTQELTHAIQQECRG